MGDKEEEQRFTIHGSVFRDKPGSVKTTRFLHRLLPISAQRSFRDGAFRAVSDYGVAAGAGVSAVFRPRLAARFLAVGRQREDYSYGAHPRQVIEVVQPQPRKENVEGMENGGQSEKPKLIVFVHGGAWGSGCTWMYRLMVDRLSRSHSSYTVASVGYRVHPDADTTGQVDDLAAAMRWISDNIGLIGFDCDPDVYLMGHSSGSHISLLYLIRRAEEQEAAAAAAAAPRDHNTLPVGAPKTGTPARASSNGGDGGDGGDGDASVGGGGSGGRSLDVEGFIGLAGVYDVYRHYLYESWRGVHEISPMKASNGGMLHTLFDYSHPHLLGNRPNRPPSSWSRTPLAPTATPSRHPQPQPQPKGQNAPLSRSPISSGISSRRALGTSPRGSGGDGAGDDDAATAVLGSSLGDVRQGGQGLVSSRGKCRALGRRLPRSLVVHGTADATVPFSQTAALGAALKTIGVPTVVRYDQGGDHFGVVGQLMFSEQSLVEKAILQFTSQKAKYDARQERAKVDTGTSHGMPRPRYPQPYPRL